MVYFIDENCGKMSLIWYMVYGIYGYGPIIFNLVCLFITQTN